MNNEKREKILKWYEKADHDLENAKLVILHNSKILDTACFHCQQSIEKYLKAYLVYQGRVIKKTHNLRFLQNSCAEYDDDFKSLNFKDLNTYASEARYPDDFLEPSLAETTEYLQIAEDVKKLVLNKVELG